jgi:hypothetical protein
MACSVLTTGASVPGPPFVTNEIPALNSSHPFVIILVSKFLAARGEVTALIASRNFT